MSKGPKRKGSPCQGGFGFTASEALSTMHSDLDAFLSSVAPRAAFWVVESTRATSRSHRNFPVLFWQGARGNVDYELHAIFENFCHARAVQHAIDPTLWQRGE
jgi:hypothetical protein